MAHAIGASFAVLEFSVQTRACSFFISTDKSSKAYCQEPVNQPVTPVKLTQMQSKYYSTEYIFPYLSVLRTTTVLVHGAGWSLSPADVSCVVRICVGFSETESRGSMGGRCGWAWGPPALLALRLGALGAQVEWSRNDVLRTKNVLRPLNTREAPRNPQPHQ